MMFLLLGSTIDDLGGSLIHLLQDVLGGGVHGLSAGDHSVHAQVTEHSRQSLVRRRRPQSHSFFSGAAFAGGLPSAPASSSGLHRLQVVGALDMLARGQVLGLGAHVLDLGQLQGAVLLGLGQGVAGGVGVDVDLEGRRRPRR